MTCDRRSTLEIARQLILFAAEKADEIVTNEGMRIRLNGSEVEKAKAVNDLVKGSKRKSFTHTEFVFEMCRIMYDGLGLSPESFYAVLKQIPA